jgi:hypothetical protein
MRTMTRAPRRFARPTPERTAEDRKRLGFALAAGAVVCAIYGLVTTPSPSGLFAGGASFLLFGLEAAVITWLARLVTSSKIPAWRTTTLALVAFTLQCMESIVLKKAGLGTMAAAWAGECFVLAVIGQSLLPAKFGAGLVIAVVSKIVVLLVALAIVAVLFTMFFAVAIH